jgi:hypothetical protein
MLINWEIVFFIINRFRPTFYPVSEKQKITTKIMKRKKYVFVRTKKILGIAAWACTERISSIRPAVPTEPG